MLTEAVLLGLVGGAVACTVAWAMVAANRSLGAFSLPRMQGVSLDGRALAFAAIVSLLTGLLFGLAPALQGTRSVLQTSLKSGDRAASHGRGGNLLRQVLVVTQVALSVVLLVGAGLLIRSFNEALRVKPGFEPRNVLTARLRLPMSFVDQEHWPLSIDFFNELVDRVEALPGVEAASAAYQLPTTSGWSNAFSFAGRPEPLPEEDNPYAIFRPVVPGYFELARISLVEGRTFTDADHSEAPRVVIVNQEFVRTFFGDGEDPIGKQLIYGNWWAGGPPEYEIVGVVEDVLFSGRTEDAFRATYFPHAQQPVREMSMMVRTSGEPMELASALRAEVAAMDPRLPVDEVATLEGLLLEDEAVRRALAVLTGFFAGSALLLAAIGVYGVMSFTVGQRTRELGIRMALGAQASHVRRMVLRRGIALALLGLLAGLAGATALSGVLRGMLFEVRPADPITLAAVSLFLGVVALIACWLPARRATRVDPLASLRGE